MKKPLLLALTILLVIAAAGLGYYVWAAAHDPAAQSHSDEVHVHADFTVHIAGEPIDFTKPEFQSTATNTLHANIHLHDGEGDIIHRHAEGITLGEFFDSLGITLTDTCFTNEVTYCTDEVNMLQLYVNGTPVDSIASYVIEDEDRLLLYYGDPNNPELPELVSSVGDRACIYSGTCPERGTPPPESCGLTCEL